MMINLGSRLRVPVLVSFIVLAGAILCLPRFGCAGEWREVGRWTPDPPADPMQLSSSLKSHESKLNRGTERSGEILRIGSSYPNVFAVAETRLVVLDVSQPSNPIEVGWAEIIDGRDAAVVGSLVFVADFDGGLKVFDIAAPANPFLIGHLALPQALAVAAAGDLAVVACEDSGVVIVSISNPSDPRVISTLPEPARTGDIAISGNLAFVSGVWPMDLYVIDISIPEMPRRVALIDDCQANGVAARGDLAFVANGGEFTIFDVSDPAQPEVVGACTAGCATRKVALDGDLAFAACTNRSLMIADISDPAMVHRVAWVDGVEYSRDVSTSGSLVFVAEGQAGVSVVQYVEGFFKGDFEDGTTEGWTTLKTGSPGIQEIANLKGTLSYSSSDAGAPARCTRRPVSRTEPHIGRSLKTSAR